MYTAVFALQANRQLRRGFVEKKGATERDDTRVWFPTRKKRVRKRPVKNA